jgi:hypothetical protein
MAELDPQRNLREVAMSRREKRETYFADDGLWDANDVALYLKASRSWVYQKAEAGVLPSLRVVGLLRFNPDAVRAFALGDDTRAPVIPLRTREQGR